MPTSYTAPVLAGEITTVEQYALICARAMGACIMMRDDPLDVPIPERFEPSTKYYDGALAEAEAVIAEVSALTDAECETRSATEFQEKLADQLRYEKNEALGLARYKTLLDQVQKWDCRAEGLKEFMMQQLVQSIGFDCSAHAPPELKQFTGPEWRELTLLEASANADRARENIAKEIERTNGRNAWLSDLRASFT